LSRCALVKKQFVDCGVYSNITTVRSIDIFKNWKQRAKQLKIETYALYLAYKDPRTPWYGKIFAACVVGYAFSPIDLIPDPIPILGYLDDLILIPIGVVLALKMIPSPVLVECREKAQVIIEQGKPINRIAAGIIIGIWLVLAILAIRFILSFLCR
jgi:uncharacterized membrane protein YkvA (DUF1232 family)